MLLETVLQLYKPYKTLNEAFKSTLMQDLQKQFEVSTLTRKKKIIDRTEIDNTNFIKLVYSEKWKDGTITYEDYTDPDKRRKILNVEMDKKQFNIYKYLKKLFSESIPDIPFDIADYTDNDFKMISKEDALKQKYSKCLLFWFGNKPYYWQDDEGNTLPYDQYDNTRYLRAITYGSKIILLVKNDENKYKGKNCYYDVNYKFTGPVDIDINVDPYKQYDEFEKFMDKAFIRIPYIELLTDKNEIKKELYGLNDGDKITGYATTKSFVNSDYNYISEVRALDPDALNNSMEKISSRKKWNEYLEQQKDINKKNIQRYNRILYIKRTKGRIDENQALTDKLFDAYIQDMQMLILYQYEFINKKINKSFYYYLTYSANQKYDTVIDIFMSMFEILDNISNQLIICKTNLKNMDDEYNGGQDITKITDCFQTFKRNMQSIKRIVDSQVKDFEMQKIHSFFDACTAEYNIPFKFVFLERLRDEVKQIQ